MTTITIRRHCKGFILPSGMTLYAALGALVVIGLLSAAVWVQSARLEAKTDLYEAFVAQVKVVGEMQEAETKRINEKHLGIVKEKDHENLIAHGKLADSAKRLRDNRRSSGGYLPNPGQSAGVVNHACFGRTELERTIQSLDDSIQGLITEGDQAIIDLNNAKQWHQEITK